MVSLAPLFILHIIGANQRPHYSIRSLVRSLEYCKLNAHIYGFIRSLYDGFIISFQMPLDSSSKQLVGNLIEKYLLKNKKIDWKLRHPGPAGCVAVSNHWVKTGVNEITSPSSFILTESIVSRISDLARILSSGYPMLLQGPTSAGKTSLISYLASITGNKFVRINNHEHTDLCEYIGNYVTGLCCNLCFIIFVDTSGKLNFVEGVLVSAVRNGHWIVLDELNLAPSEVLESLNRLLDDNRELLIVETGERITPHKDFRLFATQNPPGIYGGRKVLSRAFRNRFIEIQVDDIPQNELTTIIHDVCKIPPKYCDAMVNVLICFLQLFYA